MLQSILTSKAEISTALRDKHARIQSETCIAHDAIQTKGLVSCLTMRVSNRLVFVARRSESHGRASSLVVVVLFFTADNVRWCRRGVGFALHVSLITFPRSLIDSFLWP